MNTDAETLLELIERATPSATVNANYTYANTLELGKFMVARGRGVALILQGASAFVDKVDKGAAFSTSTVKIFRAGFAELKEKKA